MISGEAAHAPSGSKLHMSMKTATHHMPASIPKGSSVVPVIEDQQAIKPADGDFDPGRHLAFKAPERVYTMKDLCLPENNGVSPIAVSEPFRLFTEEAVLRMRAEVLSKEVLANCQYSSNLAQCQLRGFAAE